MRDSREKGAGMRDQDPPFQTLIHKRNLESHSHIFLESRIPSSKKAKTWIPKNLLGTLGTLHENVCE